MKNKNLDPENFFYTACYFEGSLVLIAMLLGWLTNSNPFMSLYFSESKLFVGLLATLPLILMLSTLQKTSCQAIIDIRNLLLTTLGPLINSLHWTHLLILSSIAGYSEEILFRGFLQPWLENSMNELLALLASNLVFGLVHAITPIYALIAMLIGIYLGVSLDYQGERNLLVPIVIHSLYDFVAFIVIIHSYRSYTINRP